MLPQELMVKNVQTDSEKKAEVSNAEVYSTEVLAKPLPELEREIMKFWVDQAVFQRSVEMRSKNNQFVIYDGPPFATGLPHYGHLLASCIKDVVPRFKTMQGMRVERRFGWDCHGVPVEYIVEKENLVNGTQGIEKMGIKEFNEKCRSIVLRFTHDWQATIERIGRFVDMKNDYKTMHTPYMESVWNVFKKLKEKGLVYEGKRVVPYSPELGTALSDFEANLDYREVPDPAITILFTLADDNKTKLLVWTTTPWSLVTNVAIAVNPKVKYVKVHSIDGNFYILAQSMVDKYVKKGHAKKIEEFDITQLIGRRYIPQFKSIAPAQVQNCYQIIAGDHVTATEGTGLVHISPAHGDEDFTLGQKYNLPCLDFVNRNCVFEEGVPNYGDTERNADFIKGKFFKDADKEVVQYLKQKGVIVKNESIVHKYPFCWRTEKPLMYRAVSSWYVNVTKIKDRLVSNNQKINWYPESVGRGRFHNWLENAHDWSVSRSRYWGTPLPIWRNIKDPEDCIFIGSVEELEKLTHKKVTDLHRDHIDELEINIENKTYRRIPEVFDCWFESGAMPYAQDHYMFENEDEFLRKYPADFIAEGLDQTRGWFYTLNVLSTALFDRPAFKNCVVNGILLGNDGKKMSKSKGNYPDSNIIFEKYGADALRLFLLGSSATRADDVAVDENKISQVVAQVVLPLTSMYRFFATYANRENIKHLSLNNIGHSDDPLDQWLLFRIEQFKIDITKYYENYNLIAVCQEIRNIIDLMSNWYLHYNRNVFIQKNVKDRAQLEKTYQYFAYALNTVCLCIAPVMPFTSEMVYRALNGYDKSVHLQDWPLPINANKYENVFKDLEAVKNIVHVGQRVRSENNVRLRQPLGRVYLDANLRNKLLPYMEIIKKGINVKEIIWTDNASGLLTPVIKLNESVIGKKYRQDAKLIKTAFEAGKYKHENGKLLIAGKELIGEEFSITYQPRDHVCGAVENNMWVVLDTHLTAELIKEGVWRDFIRAVKDIRKKTKIDVSQGAVVYIDKNLAALLDITGTHDLKESNCKIICGEASKVITYKGVAKVGSIEAELSFEVEPRLEVASTVEQANLVTAAAASLPVLSQTTVYEDGNTHYKTAKTYFKNENFADASKFFRSAQEKYNQALMRENNEVSLQKIKRRLDKIVKKEQECEVRLKV